jgi:hypothetical protein
MVFDGLNRLCTVETQFVVTFQDDVGLAGFMAVEADGGVVHNGLILVLRGLKFFVIRLIFLFYIG